METEAMETIPSVFIEGQRKKLLVILQQDPDSVLDTLLSRRVISEEEYETLDRLTDPLKKSRKLLILVQKKGERSCQHFLRCLFNTFPESAPSWDLKLEFLQHKNIIPQFVGVNKNSENTFSSERKEPGKPMITTVSSEQEQSGLETSEFFTENVKECNTPDATLPCPIGKADSEVPVTISFLRDGQRYEEPDESLYLGAEEYAAPLGFPEDAATTVEDDYGDVEHIIVCEGEEDPKYSEAMGLSDEEDHYDDSENSLPLEEEEKVMEEKRKVFKDVLSSLNMDRSRKLLPDSVKQFSLDQGSGWSPKTQGDLVWNFLLKVRALDVTARDSVLRRDLGGEVQEAELLTRLENLEIKDVPPMNPLDVLCAGLLCAERSLQREVMSNMYQCQFALPLLLPDAENNKSILMLGAMEDIVRRQSTQLSGGPTGATEESLRFMKLPVISFVRLGHCRFSKSRILNTLLSPDQLQPQRIFLHHNLSVPLRPRQISDGLVEITWYFPDDDHLKQGPHIFHKPFAVTNLRGDLECFWTQFGFLMEVSSAVFFFTDCLGEKEWDLLMFLGEIAIERCCFVLSPRARETEEAQMFQRMLNLKSSQLLFLEGEESGDGRKNMEALRAALQEGIASSLRCVSVEEMASLARELGIQVDQDFETNQGVQGSPRKTMARATEDEGQQICSQLNSSSESQALIALGKTGPAYEVNQNIQNLHSAPLVTSQEENSPLPTTGEGNFNCVSSKAPQVMGSWLGSAYRPRWFWPLLCQNRSAHRRGKSFGIKYFQPQKSYSGEKSMRLPRTPWGRHLNGTFGRPPSSISPCAWAWCEKPRMTGALRRPGVSKADDSHPARSQLAGTGGKLQPARASAPGTQLTGAAGKRIATASHIRSPHPQSFRSAGAIQKPARPTFHQGPQMMTHDRPSNPVLQTGSHPIPRSKLLPSFQFKPHHQLTSPQPKPFQPLSQIKPPKSQSSQAKPPLSKAPQPKACQSQLSQYKPPQAQSSQAKPFQSKSPWLQTSQAKPSPCKTLQTKPCQSRYSQSKPSQPRSLQHQSSCSSPSQAKANHSRAGPKRMGRH